ncbi:unnamed protein product, partial [Soboliphyme baturini]|uniref:Protein kinase domain-containing protein n=1 Tax=Soboliphyme baturini TaxID=241478 RepID=A0A183J5R8_9BILA
KEKSGCLWNRVRTAGVSHTRRWYSCVVLSPKGDVNASYGRNGSEGVWIPEGQKVKIPVAIKVLHESNAVAEKEMLEEAGIMASMSDPYLVRLIGVCFSQQMMMVTPLMPLGNLLEYVQNNKSKIGSAALIQHRLVHRDLAARNVLVQNPYHVRITDFGLAKLLDYGQDEIKIYEGKVTDKSEFQPGLLSSVFNTKGTPINQMFGPLVRFTFPIYDIPLHEIPARLQNGERLPQPKIATLEVYMMLIRCKLLKQNPLFTTNVLQIASIVQEVLLHLCNQIIVTSRSSCESSRA